MRGDCEITEKLLEAIKAFNEVGIPVFDFVQRVNSLQERIASEMNSQKKLRSEWRRSSREFKWFKEEICTIRTFINKYGQDGESVAVISGNQSFDGKWESLGGEVFLEVTAAVDGHLNSRLVEHLEKYGHAPVTFENPMAIKQDKKLSREYLVEATCVETAIKKDCEMILDRIRAKVSSKKYFGHYVLLVNYCPGLPARFEEVVEAITPLPPNSVFERVFLVEPWRQKIAEMKS